MSNTFTEVVKITTSTAEYINKCLSNEIHLDEDSNIVYSVIFSDGMQADLKVCGTQDEDESAWTEMVLFDKNGYELGCTEPNETFLRKWQMLYNDNFYKVIVTVTK